jgi:hypothetical protein
LKKIIKCKKNKEHEEHSNPNSSNINSNLDHISRNKKHKKDGSQSLNNNQVSNIKHRRLSTNNHNLVKIGFGSKPKP